MAAHTDNVKLASQGTRTLDDKAVIIFIFDPGVGED